jgi:hypothetical protein
VPSGHRRVDVIDIGDAVGVKSTYRRRGTEGITPASAAPGVVLGRQDQSRLPLSEATV